MAVKLYVCRDTAKRFYKDEYKSKLEPYTVIVKTVMKANNVEEIPALLKISETKLYQENPMNQIMFVCAVTELMDLPPKAPSKNQQ